MIRWLLGLLCRLLPERVIEREDGKVYLRRYYLLGNPEVLEKYFPPGSRPRWWQRPFAGWKKTAYLHRFESSDIDEELHDHPWSAASLILAGGYLEERLVPRSGSGSFVDRFPRRPGAVVRLEPGTYHKVLLFEDDCWSLIVVGERSKSWGFWNPRTSEYLPWKEHAARRASRRASTESPSKKSGPGSSSG